MKELASTLLFSLFLCSFGWAQGIAATRDPDTNFLQSTVLGRPLFVPKNCNLQSGTVDLLIHFHGHPPVVKENLLRSGKLSCLLVVNENGLSAAYAKPFKDAASFSNLLASTQSEIATLLKEPVAFRRIAISSFSAGYGAVREILQQPATNRITDLVLADSLYAGYVTNLGKVSPIPEQVEPFIRFAQRAFAGEVTMVLTHSQLAPGTYASTVETADAILSALGLTREKVPGKEPGIRVESRARKGQFLLRSYTGSTGEDHMWHLRNMALALKETDLRDSKN